MSLFERLGGFTAATMQWAANVTAPTLTQITQSANIKGADLTITPQQSTHATDQGGGNVVMNFQTPAGAGAEAGLLFQRGGSTIGYWAMNNTIGLGPVPAYFAISGAQSATNWFLAGAASQNFVNAGIELGFGIAGSLGGTMDMDANGIHVFARAQGLGSGVGVIGIKNATTNPSTNPSLGGVLYANSGAGTWRGSGGTTTAFGPA